MNSDRFPTNVVVVALAIVVVAGLASLVFLSSTGTTIPDALDRLIFTALGALGSLLARPQPSDEVLPVEEVDE